MKVLIARFTARPGCADEVAEMIIGLAQNVHTEAGNIIFEPYRDADDPNRFIVIEKYLDEDAFYAHLAMPYGKPFNDRLNELIEEPHSQLTFLNAVE